MHQNESALIQSCLAGNQTAWDEFVEQYGRLVYSIPRRYGLGTEDCEEVFQNVFAITYRQLSSLRNSKAVIGWLATIAHRETLRLLRQTHPQDELDEKIEDSQAPPIEQVQRWERQHYLRQALGKLEATCRELLTILFLRDPPPVYEDIAKQLKLSVGSIGPYRARCMKKLESVLASMGIDLTI